MVAFPSNPQSWHWLAVDLPADAALYNPSQLSPTTSFLCLYWTIAGAISFLKYQGVASVGVVFSQYLTDLLSQWKSRTLVSISMKQVPSYLQLVSGSKYTFQLPIMLHRQNTIALVIYRIENTNSNSLLRSSVLAAHHIGRKLSISLPDVYREFVFVCCHLWQTSVCDYQLIMIFLICL